MNSVRCCVIRHLAFVTFFLTVLTGTAFGEDFQVNTYTTDAQRRAAIGVDAAGDFIVVWHSEGSSGTDSSEFSVQGQRYAANGSPVGGEFQLNSYTTERQWLPAVSVGADGEFVAVWESEGSSGTDSSGFSIQGQRYSSDGSTLGGEFQVNNITTNGQRRPAVALQPDGGFVVAWQSDAEYAQFREIQLRRFASDGSPIRQEFQVNTFTISYQSAPEVAMAGNGDFVVVWLSHDFSTLHYSVQGQRFSSDGSFLGEEFQVNTSTPYYQFQPAVAMAEDGEFVVVWHYSDPVKFLSTIQGQRFGSDGSFVGTQFQVDSNSASYSGQPSVAISTHGGFLVLWQGSSSETDTSLTSIQGRRFTSDGSAIGGDFQINTYTTDRQFEPVVGLNSSGGFVAAWSSLGSGGTDTSNSSVQGSLFGSIFADSFESGDFSAWSASVP